jgi:hypothetical protein
MRFYFIIIAALLCGTLVSCTKDDAANKESEGYLNLGTISSAVKRAVADADYKLSDATKVTLTISQNGKTVDGFNLKEVKVVNWGSSNFSTEDVKLKTGSGYKLEHFSLQDKDNKTIFAAPVKGSVLAPKVKTPLAIDFSIQKDKRTEVVVEVLSTKNSTPADFGYAYFIITTPGNKTRLIKKITYLYREGVPKLTFRYDYTYKTGDVLDFFTRNDRDKFVCEYNAEGKLVAEVLNPNLKNVYVYDSEGRVKEYIRGVKSSGLFYNKHVYKYDGAGRVDEENIYNTYTDGKLRHLRRIKYVYNPFNRKDYHKVIAEPDDKGGFVNKLWVDVTLDEKKEKVVKEVKYFWDSDERSDKPTYDETRRISRIEYTYQKY